MAPPTMAPPTTAPPAVPPGAKGLPTGVEIRPRPPRNPKREKPQTWREDKSIVRSGPLHFFRQFCHREGLTCKERPHESYREVFIGNLIEADPEELADTFDSMFSRLPEFHHRYPHLPVAVERVKLGRCRTSGFVQLSDAVLASTAMQMNLFRIRGRPVTVVRPRRYEVPTEGEAIALDVTPLRQMGLLPSLDDMRVGYKTALKRRQLYVGGLEAPGVTEQELRELLDYICVNLDEYNPASGSAVLDMAAFDGKYAFVELQSAQLAGAALRALTSVVIRGYPLHVMLKKSIHRNAVA